MRKRCGSVTLSLGVSNPQIGQTTAAVEARSTVFLSSV